MKKSLLVLALTVCAFAQSTGTLIQGNLVDATGAQVDGNIIVSWPTFLSGSTTIDAGTQYVAVTAGQLSLRLAPTPSGISYNVTTVSHGTSTSFCWSVPASATPVLPSSLVVSCFSGGTGGSTPAPLQVFVSTSGETAYALATAPSGTVAIFHNGALLSSPSDYTITANILTLTVPATLGDIVQVLSFTGSGGTSTGGSGSSGGTPLTGYFANVSSSLSTYIPGSVHSQGSFATPTCWSGTNGTGIAARCSYIRDASGNLTFIFYPPFTGSIVIAPNGGVSMSSSGTVNIGSPGQIAGYTSSGSTLSGLSSLPQGMGLYSAGGYTPVLGGVLGFNSTQQSTVAGGNGSLTGSLPRLIYAWDGSQACDILAAHGGDTSPSYSYGCSTPNNTTGTEGTSRIPFTTQPLIPNGFLVQGKRLRIIWNLGVWSNVTTVPLVTFSEYWGATQVYRSQAVLQTASAVNYGFNVTCFITANGSVGSTARMTADCQPQAPGFTAFAMANLDVPSLVATNADTSISLQPLWSSTGLFSATYVSGGTFVGTGYCTLGTFNDGMVNVAATIAVASNIPGAITITNTGYGATAAPTSSVVTTGTATCSGTIVIASVLGGAQGNALQLRGLTVEELN